MKWRKTEIRGDHLIEPAFWTRNRAKHNLEWMTNTNLHEDTKPLHGRLYDTPNQHRLFLADDAAQVRLPK